MVNLQKNRGEYGNISTNWVACYVTINYAIYFDRFGVVYVLKEIKNMVI